MMRIFISLLIFSLLMPFTGAFAQTLFSFGGKPVSKQEFLQAFNKNPESGDHKKAIADYLPLYINYKLKVQDAYDKKMDTLQNQTTEVDNYKAQIIESFRNSRSGVDGIVREVFMNSQRDILLGHLFIEADASNAIASANAASQAAKAAAALNNGQPFADVVRQYGTNADRMINGGTVGWITALNLPYQYENAIYQLKTGSHTAPIKGPTGWHIFRKIETRPAAGRVKVAQILIFSLDKSNPQAGRHIADSTYQLLQNGASFESLVAGISADRSSLGNGGIIPPFGIGTYDAAFENAAFGLAKPGDISLPFETGFGWHILKLIEKIPVVTDSNDAENKAALRQQILETGRAENARRNYLESQLPTLQFKAAANFDFADLWQFADSITGNKKPAPGSVKAKTPLFYFGATAYTATDFTNYIGSVNGNLDDTWAASQLFDAFKMATAEAEWQKNALRLNPELAAQVKEFKDANLLFEAMDREVWTKAAESNTALNGYYKTNAAKYTWGASVNAIMVTTDSLKMTGAQVAIKAAPENWRNPFETSGQNQDLMVDSGRFELSQLPDLKPEDIKPGSFTPVTINPADRSQTSAYIISMNPAGGKRSFEEARGFVINDYQTVLETRWINKLKQKYPVVVNQALLKTL